MEKLVGVIGNYVEGDRFWGREMELDHLLELIDEGANVSIIAQRRIGKTSLMHEAAPSSLGRFHTLAPRLTGGRVRRRPGGQVDGGHPTPCFLVGKNKIGFYQHPKIDQRNH